jgi:hypothetical protein
MKYLLGPEAHTRWGRKPPFPYSDKEEVMEPNYFTQVWKEKTGYDPVVMEAKQRLWRRVYDVTICLTFLLAIVTIAVLFYCTKHSNIPNVRLIGFIGVGSFTGMICGCLLLIFASSKRDQWKERLRSFKTKLDNIACHLRRNPEELVSLSQPELTSEAISRLKGLGGYLKKVEKIQDVTGESKETISNLRERVGYLYKDCVFWKLIEDTGWDPYFAD